MHDLKLLEPKLVATKEDVDAINSGYTIKGSQASLKINGLIKVQLAKGKIKINATDGYREAVGLAISTGKLDNVIIEYFNIMSNDYDTQAIKRVHNKILSGSTDGIYTKIEYLLDYGRFGCFINYVCSKIKTIKDLRDIGIIVPGVLDGIEVYFSDKIYDNGNIIEYAIKTRVVANTEILESVMDFIDNVIKLHNMEEAHS